MKAEVGYRLAFDLLDECYSRTKYDGLGSLLGDMNPDQNHGYHSADPAMFEEWMAMFNIEQQLATTPEDCFDNMMLFLRVQGESMGLNFDDVIRDIVLKKESTVLMWSNAAGSIER